MSGNRFQFKEKIHLGHILNPIYQYHPKHIKQTHWYEDFLEQVSFELRVLFLHYSSNPLVPWCHLSIFLSSLWIVLQLKTNSVNDLNFFILI